MMSPAAYLTFLESTHRSEKATEHSYRPAFAAFLESRGKEEVTALNDPKREKCGAPDYTVFRRRDRLTVGWAETKDFGLGGSLDEVVKTEQLKRYFAHLPNLLVTDYLHVRWYVRREQGVKLEGEGHLGRLVGGKIVSDSAEQEKALAAIDGFVRHKPARLTSAKDLAVRLADFTQMIRGIIVNAFAEGEATESLRDWRTAFAHTLLPELAANPDAAKERAAVAEFADMFAQTLTYGLFSARAAAPGGAFTRENARKLVPRTNPFLRNFFEQITGAALDDEPFAGFVEDIIQTLGHADIDAVLADFGTRNRRSDPVVHFYETFLHAYDPKLRELRGVYYTPEPVVNYIVESLDELLKEKFGIKEGLADRSKITVERKEGEKTVREESHRVLILDPATGTATFLYRVLDFIRQQFDKKKRAGAWGDYVHEHLLPRLFGFELLMAPYAVAHFKLGLALAARDEPELWRQRWSYEPRKDERINIFLTNTLEDLEETAQQLGPLRMLSNEANSAYEIKQNKPVLVILGNPPYAGHSANKGEWITSLIREYMRCDGKPLGEKNPKYLHDDYVKFIRWAQWRIEQTGQGIVGFITNHGYLDNPTFRGMRQSLMNTFDEIYLVDLHGNQNKGETDPDTGRPDKNVFDIKQGVAIGIFVKRAASAKLATTCVVRHAHVFRPTQKEKYDWLETHSLGKTEWTVLSPKSPDYYFFPRDLRLLGEYERGWRMQEVMPVNRMAAKSHRDDFSIAYDFATAEKRLQDLRNRELRAVELLARYRLVETDTFDVAAARKADPTEFQILPCLYRPFDHRFMIYSRFTFDRPRAELQHHILAGSPALITTRQTKELFGVFVTTDATAQHKLVATYDTSYLAPLYLYPNGKLPDDDLFVREEAEEEKRRPNFGAAFIDDFCARLKVKFVPDGLGKPSKRQVGPELIFHYAYAVFHSPAYRERYAEFLRTDFPRLPLTSDYDLFRELAGFGGTLVDLHARNQADGSAIGYPINGDNVIEEVRYEPPLNTGKDRHAGRVWINDKQYFDGVAPEAWSFPIGGYLPAQRWLKDRTGRTLSYEEKEAYPRIVVALSETGRLMREIDAAIANHGGWPKAFV